MVIIKFEIKMAGSFDPACEIAEEEEEPQLAVRYAPSNKTIAITTTKAAMKTACFLVSVIFLSDILPPP